MLDGALLYRQKLFGRVRLPRPMIKTLALSSDVLVEVILNMIFINTILNLIIMMKKNIIERNIFIKSDQSSFLIQINY